LATSLVLSLAGRALVPEQLASSPGAGIKTILEYSQRLARPEHRRLFLKEKL
jgi:hypothetical protein